MNVLRKYTMSFTDEVGSFISIEHVFCLHSHRCSKCKVVPVSVASVLFINLSLIVANLWASCSFRGTSSSGATISNSPFRASPIRVKSFTNRRFTLHILRKYLSGVIFLCMLQFLDSFYRLFSSVQVLRSEYLSKVFDLLVRKESIV